MKDRSEIMKDVGKVRKRKIMIQKLTLGQDDIGNTIETWPEWQVLWVEVNSLFGSEYYAAATINEENTLKFTARYAPFIDDIDNINYRISYKSKLYDIKNVDLLSDNGMWVIIKALERGVNHA